MNAMTCRQFDEVVHGFVRVELLDVNLREMALEHASRCSDCAERMAEATALADAAEVIGGEMRDEQAPPRVEAAVLAEFRSYHRRAVWRRTFEWATVGAVAAILLLFGWTFNGRSKERLQPPAGKDVSSKSQLPVDAKLDVKAPAVSQQNDATQGIEAKLPEVSADEASVAETYAASDFVPVPFTGAIAADDPGMVVRVQLTRASLAQLGYPVADAPDDDLIRADVLVGEDGWPRGVKLIR